MRTHWWGDDCPSVRLKIGIGHNHTVRDRTWEVSPGIVDVDLVFRYWTEARPHLLSRAGLLAEGDALDFDAELAGTGPRFAMFVSDRSVFPKPGEKARVEKVSEIYGLWREDPATGEHCRVKPGNVAESTIRSAWEKAIHFLVHDVLRFPGVPARLAECKRTGSQWRGMLGPHGDRSATGWYIGGVLNDWTMAEQWTNDRRSTLEKHYAILPKWMQAHRGTGTLLDVDLYSEILSWMLWPSARQATLHWSDFREQFRAVTQARAAGGRSGWVQAYRRTPEEVARLEEALMNGPGTVEAVQPVVKVRRGGRRGTYAGSPRHGRASRAPGHGEPVRA
jgi:hypothetical protein